MPKSKSPKKSASPKGSKGKSKSKSKSKSPKGSKGSKGSKGTKGSGDTNPVTEFLNNAPCKYEIDYYKGDLHPPKPTPLSNIMRAVWYPYANRMAFDHTEWNWTPYCPVITSWGDVWVSDAQFQRIYRFKFNPISAQISMLKEPLLIRGEPRQMCEIPVSGFMAVVVTCRKLKKMEVQIFHPMTDELIKVLEFPFFDGRPARPESPKGSKGKKKSKSKSKSPSKSPKGKSKKGSKEKKESGKGSKKGSKKSGSKGSKGSSSGKEEIPEEPVHFVLDDMYSATGICANKTFIFISTQPMQRIVVYDAVKLVPVQAICNNYYSDEYGCTHLSSSGGINASEDMLYVTSTRPPKVQAFWLTVKKVLGNIETVIFVKYAELGLDRLSIGEPFSVVVDPYGAIVVADSLSGYVRVYNIVHRQPGPFYPSLPHGESCYMGCWKINAFSRNRLGYFSLAKNGVAAFVDRWENKLIFVCDRETLRKIDDTYLYLFERNNLRSFVDKLMPPPGLPNKLRNVPPVDVAWCKEFEPIDPEQLLPSNIAELYMTPAQRAALEEERAASPKKGSKKDSKGSKSKKSRSKSPKESKKKSSKGKKTPKKK